MRSVTITLSFVVFFVCGCVHGAAQTVHPVDFIELNFDPNEDLKIPRDSVDLRALDQSQCTEIRTVYPFIRINAHNRVGRLQECFIGPNQEVRLNIVTYYDYSLSIKTPVAFVFETKQGSGYEVQWGRVDRGFIDTGCVTRVWQIVEPTQGVSFNGQLLGILIPGFRRAGRIAGCEKS